jgi:hypothetical protein
VEYSQGGLPSQNEEGILFGLNKDEEIVKVKIRWPSNREPMEATMMTSNSIA